MKICYGCNIEKDITQFNKDKSQKDGLCFRCKVCISSYFKNRRQVNLEKSLIKERQYRSKNRTRINEYSKKYKENHPEQRKETRDLYYMNNKSNIMEKAKVYHKYKRETDVFFKLKANLRTRLYAGLQKKSWRKNTKFSEYIGCTLEELRLHLESQFKEGMTWDNYGEWEIDHIIPLSSAKTELEIYELCHYSNLQPLWSIDNIKKGNKI